MVMLLLLLLLLLLDVQRWHCCQRGHTPNGGTATEITTYLKQICTCQLPGRRIPYDRVGHGGVHAYHTPAPVPDHCLNTPDANSQPFFCHQLGVQVSVPSQWRPPSPKTTLPLTYSSSSTEHTWEREAMFALPTSNPPACSSLSSLADFRALVSSIRKFVYWYTVPGQYGWAQYSRTRAQGTASTIRQNYRYTIHRYWPLDPPVGGTIYTEGRDRYTCTAPHVLLTTIMTRRDADGMRHSCSLCPATPRLPDRKWQYRSMTRNPRGVADEMQPKRRGGILVSSRLNDRQRSNAGARMLWLVQTKLGHVRGGLRLVAKFSLPLYPTVPIPSSLPDQQIIQIIPWAEILSC
ncbi:hypothetical protein LEMA_P107130.1 [Plenodomus lingam JN3]|uniref:Ig-like domain-containing protein n=1 Tax=Leptosphaeria maculans (strain JN3 / isolate v23.1.3 / race Av1-4-5-6-7-8) TaxID=985895 RepID=E4ZZ13_LEPMJ|nr:hypothetical protein LEMA_P107130.1 [Plenodomus lingam JN3]CBX96448.1 hypothetical protein LEMA_P107130.1 [Plenodomus lingam JN3]